MKFCGCLFVLLLVSGFCTYGQSVVIGNGGVIPDNSAALDLQSTNKGLLLPRMTQAARLLIDNPATGLLVYQTDSLEGFYFNMGTPQQPVWMMTGGEPVFARTNGVIHTASSPANDFLFGHQYLPGPAAVDDTLFWFQKDKGAFRNGLLESSGWTSIGGIGSFTTGRNSRPTGLYAFASGESATAAGRASFSAGTGTSSTGEYSVATGLSSKANGPMSFASGLGVQADGIYTQAFGDNTRANTVNCFVVGMYNNPVFGVQTDPNDLPIFVALRPHFIAGIGQNQDLRMNAIAVHTITIQLQDLQVGEGTRFTNFQTGKEVFNNSCGECIINVTFKTPYPSPPSKVFVTLQMEGGFEVYSYVIKSITTTGFAVQVRREASSSPTPPVVVMWTAMQ